MRGLNWSTLKRHVVQDSRSQIIAIVKVKLTRGSSQKALIINQSFPFENIEKLNSKRAWKSSTQKTLSHDLYCDIGNWIEAVVKFWKLILWEILIRAWVQPKFLKKLN